MPSYYVVEQGKLNSTLQPPIGLMPIAHGHAMLQPPLMVRLHRSFRAWGEAGYSPGPITPQRVFAGAEGQLAFSFAEGQHPARLMQNVGAAQDLAAWLVLLDKWAGTQNVIEQAQAVWSPQQLASALPFVTPAFLPGTLVAYPPANWVRVARAIAYTLAPEAPAGSFAAGDGPHASVSQQ